MLSVGFLADKAQWYWFFLKYNRWKYDKGRPVLTNAILEWFESPVRIGNIQFGLCQAWQQPAAAEGRCPLVNLEAAERSLACSFEAQTDFRRYGICSLHRYAFL